MARIIFLEIVCLDEVRVIIVAYQRVTNSGTVTTATIPYIRGTYETIARLLQQYTCYTQTNNHFTATAY